MLARTALLGLLVLPAPLSGGSAQLIEKVLVFDPTGRTCLNCSNDDDIDPIRGIISSRAEQDIIQWVGKQFVPVDAHRRDAFLRHIANGDPIWGLSSAMSSEDGVAFFINDRQLRYRKVRCRFWDCYKQYLALIDPSGRKRWQRRIKPFEMPVFPFVVGDKVLFVAWKTGSERTCLVVLDLTSGATLEEYALPEDAGSFLLTPRFLSSFPFYKDGYIVLQGMDFSRGASEASGQSIYVLKVRF